MITEIEFEIAKKVVNQYEEQLRLYRVSGSSKCPFCSGTKTKPFVRALANQNCTDCNSDGQISNRKLVAMGLDDCIEKNCH